MTLLLARAFRDGDKAGFTTEALRARMIQGIPELAPGDVDVTPSKRGAWDVQIDKDKGGDGAIAAKFLFNGASGFASAESIDIAPGLYGARIGPRLMRNALTACAASATPHIAFDAGAYMGGYVWARNGGILDGAPAPFLVQELNRRVMALKPFLAAQDYFPLQDAAQLRHPHDMRFIAHSRHVLARDAALAALENIPDALEAARMRLNPLLARAHVNAGAFALAGLRYKALIRTDDPLAWAMLNRAPRQSAGALNV